MSRRTTPLSLDNSDGTSQRGRALAALDPTSAAIDERGHADLLAFVQAFAERLRYVEADEDGLRDVGTWSEFARREDLSIADIVAYMADPDRFTGEAARWLGRPHFGLLLTFLELLGHARAQLNGLTGRHLDHYFREVLGLRPAPPVPDRVSVAFRLAKGVLEHRLPAGAEIQAGRDPSGALRIYRTERELLVTRARVDILRSIHVHRRIVGLRELGAIRGQSVDEAFERALNLAYGEPRPGDPAPRWQGRALDRALFRELAPLLDFVDEHLGLDHHELRRLMDLVRRRGADGGEWDAINRLLGADGIVDPRDFAGNLARVVGPLDFAAAGLTGVASVEELHERRAEPEVRAFIDEHLAAIGYVRFDAAMAIKRRIDGEWREINRILERSGRRSRGAPAWQFVPTDPSDFAANLAQVLGDAWPPPWPAGVTGVVDLESWLRALERHLALPVERIRRLVTIAGSIERGREAVWPELTEILLEAYAERPRAARRAAIEAARRGHDDLIGLDASVQAALGAAAPLAWEEARVRLGERVDAGHLDVVDRFRLQLVDPSVPRRFTWEDVDRTLELAQRGSAAEDAPRPRRIEWRNLYAHDEPTALLAEPGSTRWKTFGRPPIDVDESQPPSATIGWGVSSPALALSQGRRSLTLTIGLRDLDHDEFARGLDLDPGAYEPKALLDRLRAALKIEVTTADGWIEAPLVSVRLATGASDDDYWSILGGLRGDSEERPALQLGVILEPSVGALVAIDGASSPTLRVTLRHRWDSEARAWVTRPAPFEALRLAALHLRVDVDGLVDLRLQHEERAIDPRRPFEPFGARPAVGARLYLSHPELVASRLDSLRFDVEWMGLPPSLRAHYHNYPGITGAGDFKARVSLVDRGLHLALGDASLFHEGPAPESTTASDQRIEFVDIGAALAASNPGYRYTRVVDAARTPRDLREAERCLLLELGPHDFGHAAFPVIAARASRELAIALARGEADAAMIEAQRVDPPHTPTLRHLSVGYRSSIEIVPGDAGDGVDRLLHIHPFGVSTIDGGDPRLLPAYDVAGELYIGLVDVDAPQRLALLLVVADGTSDPDVEPAGVSWSIRDGERWIELGDKVVRDSTRGLINSGILEVDLPTVAPSDLLPAGRTWLRASITGDPSGVCDMVAIRAQAVTAVFDDRGNSAEHYARPLAAGSVERLVEGTPAIAAIEQPFTSVGGRPPEAADGFYTRVSERLRHKRRALTPWDFERLVLQRFTAIYKAKCLPASATRGPGAVDVLVIPDLRAHLPADAFAPRASADLLAEIQEHLQAIAPTSARVVVRNPHYVAVSVRLGVRFRAGEDVRRASERLGDDLSRFLSPWAYDEGAELTIGGRIYASSILDFVDRREYVDYVAEIRLARSDNGVDFTVLPPTDEDYHVAAERPDQVLVAARQHHIDVIRERDYQQTSFTGIDYLKVELDFIIG